MNDKGQTTVFFSLTLSVLLIFTFTAFEVIRIHMGKVRELACVHSIHSNVMADYNRELFDRYHLLFLDPTYGTGSEGVLEERICDYFEESLNGEDSIYNFSVPELAVSDAAHILDDDMYQVKRQIAEYEREAGVLEEIGKLRERISDTAQDIADAANETETNGVEREALSGEDGAQTAAEDGAGTADGSGSQTEDPRDVLSNMLKLGILNIVMPANDLSDERLSFADAPSAKYREDLKEEKDVSFTDIGKLKEVLKNAGKEKTFDSLTEESAFLVYVKNQFSSGVHPYTDTKLRCEIEYILEGKNSDYDNMEAVANEIVWNRMPINYAYLLSDFEKKGEAEALATTICVATGTEALIEVVKYLLLGCWAYGESLCEMKRLAGGEEISFLKNAANWQTDLKTLTGGKRGEAVNGLRYEDYLLLLLAERTGKRKNVCYSRMLDVMELNLKEQDSDFSLLNCVGSLKLQGRLRMEPLFLKRNDEVYEMCFEDEISYLTEE